VGVGWAVKPNVFIGLCCGGDWGCWGVGDVGLHFVQRQPTRSAPTYAFSANLRGQRQPMCSAATYVFWFFGEGWWGENFWWGSGGVGWAVKPNVFIGGMGFF